MTKRRLRQAGNVSRQLRAKVRGRVSPVLLALAHSATTEAKDALVITGFARSGTTWLAEAVGAAPGVGIVFEPLNLFAVDEAKDAGCDWQNFRLPGEEWAVGESFIRKVLEGRIRTAWTMSHLPCHRALSVRRWLIKFVRANQMLGWMGETFGISAPVLLIRHPCAIFASWTERGWPLMQTPRFLRARFFNEFPEYRAPAEVLSRPEEYFAASWCMDYLTALRQSAVSGCQICFYEDLVVNSTVCVSKILKRWNLEWNDAVAQALQRPSTKASPRLKGLGDANLDGWKRRIDGAVADRVIEVTKRFGIDIYSADGAPRPESARAIAEDCTATSDEHAHGSTSSDR